MGGVRPITTTWEFDPDYSDVPRDMWIMARSKIKYYGAYPAGFLERSRNILVGGRMTDSIWHIPGGMAHTYNDAKGVHLKAYGPNDFRIDLNPDVNPDLLMDIRDMHMLVNISDTHIKLPSRMKPRKRPDGIIIDLPYTMEDADHYAPGREKLPSLNEILKQSLRIVAPGGLVGVLDYRWPNGSKYNAKCILAATVTTGEGSRARLFTAWKNA